MKKAVATRNALLSAALIAGWMMLLFEEPIAEELKLYKKAGEKLSKPGGWERLIDSIKQDFSSQI